MRRAGVFGNFVIIIIMLMIITSTSPVYAQNFDNIWKDELTSHEYNIKHIRGEPGQIMHFSVEADRPINIYIRIPETSYTKNKDYVDLDYFDDTAFILTKTGQNSYDFIWEVPENRGYILYAYNPNYGNVTFEVKYTDPYYENLYDIILYVVVFMVILVVIIIIIFAYRSRSRKRRAKRSRGRKRY